MYKKPHKIVSLTQYFAFSSSFGIYLLCLQLRIKDFDNWSFWYLSYLHKNCKVYFNCKSNILVRLLHENNQRTAVSKRKVFIFLTITQRVPRFHLWGNRGTALGLDNFSGNGDERNGKVMEHSESHQVVSPEDSLQSRCLWPLMTLSLLHEKHFTHLEVSRFHQSCSLQALWLPLISYAFGGSSSGLFLKSVALSLDRSRQDVTQI